MPGISLRMGGVLLVGLLLCGFAEPIPVTFQAADPDLSAGGIAKVRGLLAKPEGDGPFPAVVILHTCGGVRLNLSRDWPAFYVRHGFASLTVDSFGSRGLGPCPNAFAQPSARDRMNPYKAVASDAHGALDYLESRPFIKKGRTAVIGHSFGGIVIHLAILPTYAEAKRVRMFRAAISLYGPCGVKGGAVAMPKLKRSPIPLLEIIGEKDARVLRHCKKLLPLHPSVELHILPGAYHAFDVEWFSTLRYGHAGAPMLYHEKAARVARELVRAFLARHLEK